MKKALITGISGQDGSYLAEHLLESGYEVYGMIRRQSVSENQTFRINAIEEMVNTSYGDMTDPHSITKMVSSIQPDELYNLAAMSHVKVSFDVPAFTIQTNALGVLNVLEAVRVFSPHTKVYQASSSEMFGNSIDSDGAQRLTTPMNPVSPYGCAKLLGYNLVRHYRNAYKMHACNGILFNHESPRRGSNFITNKVVKGAVEIKHGLKKDLVLGNLESSRDWGHSRDYVRAMNMIVNHGSADDFIIATGESRTVRELCQYVFTQLGMNYEDFIKQDKKYMRPEELQYLRGDSSKARSILGWKPTYTFETMLDEMIEYWDARISKRKQ